MNILPVIVATLPFLILQTGLGWAQSTHTHEAMMDNPAMQHQVEMGGVAEPGQGAFAAIAEIVTLLRQDPATNWKYVDIDGLRTHLVDMDVLMTDTIVSTVQITNGIEMTIQLGDRAGEAARRMVPAHGPVLASETGWVSEVEETKTTLIWRVVSAPEAHVISALGFYGLMAVGDHHTVHHLSLAQGKMVH